MTLAKIIALTDEMKPNAFSKEAKTLWINEIENTVVEEVINKAEGNDITFKPYTYDADQEKELLVPDAHSDVYSLYLSSKIDFNNREFGGFNNSTVMFSSAYDDYAKEYRRNHLPKQSNSEKGY